MAKKPYSTTSANQKPIEQYQHTDKDRLNNPPVGLVNEKIDMGFCTFSF